MNHRDTEVTENSFNLCVLCVSVVSGFCGRSAIARSNDRERLGPIAGFH